MPRLLTDGAFLIYKNLMCKKAFHYAFFFAILSKKNLGGIDVRVSWDEYFMDIAEIVKTRSTCMRRQVGAVIVKDNRIITTGYNGAPSGCHHCTEIGTCFRQEHNIPSGERHEMCRALHAEQNAIIQAARIGNTTDGATIYVTDQPCVICAKMCINAGIKRIVYAKSYPDELSLQMLNEAGIELCKVDYSDK